MVKKELLFVDIQELIVGFLIAQSFLNANNIFIPILDVFQDNDRAVNAFGLVLAYFIVISGWIGYHNSVTKRPHLGNKGIIRYGIDFIILFLAYYIIQISNPDSEAQYCEVFLWVLPATFICYSYWDVLKWSEYRNQRNLAVEPRRVKITVYFSVIFYVISFLYYYININYSSLGLTFSQNKTSVDVYFILISLFLICFYRYLKRQVVKELASE